MPQQSLMPPETTTAIAVAASNEAPPENSALADLRTRALAVPVPVMLAALSEYKERRVAFREWLRSQLQEGTHFGYPPGCLPDKNVSPKQWTAKPSLYKAGADFICDLLGARDEYEADAIGWQQAGSHAGTFVYACRLFSRMSGELIGEGRGSAKSGVKKRDDNGAIKVAKKSAKVDAVLSSYGLSDLFVQDVEDMAQPPHDNPEQNKNAPNVQPRDERVTEAQLKKLVAKWKAQHEDKTVEDWSAFVFQNCGRRFKVTSLSEWSRGDFKSVWNRLHLDEVGHPDDQI